MSSNINISLSDPLRKWVDSQIGKRGYRTAKEFVEDVLRREQAMEAREKIDDLLTESLNSEKATPMTGKDWKRIRAAGLKLAREKRKK